MIVMERPRMYFDCPEPLKRAIKLRAAATGKTQSESIQAILEAELAGELATAEENMRKEARSDQQKGKKA